MPYLRGYGGTRYRVATDIRNAGGTWVDQKVGVAHGLVTGRNPDDLPAFCAKLVEAFPTRLRPVRTGRSQPARRQRAAVSILPTCPGAVAGLGARLEVTTWPGTRRRAVSRSRPPT